MKFSVEAPTTRIFRLGEDLAKFVVGVFPSLPENSLLVVTSKIVSIAEQNIVPTADGPKEALVRREADRYIGRLSSGVHLTLKAGALIPSAGIDESNAEGEFYILYPRDPFQSAMALGTFLKKHYGRKNLGIILSDSRTLPLRRGVTGFALSWWGFRPVQSLVGQPDLFGREFKMTQINVADSLATAATFAMGEGLAPRPLALIEGAEVEFTDSLVEAELKIPFAEDLYYDLYKSYLQTNS